MDKNKRLQIAEHNSDAIILEDFDDAIIGISECGRVVYSINIIYEILFQNAMDQNDIVEYVDYNIIYSYLGEFSPIYTYQL